MITDNTYITEEEYIAAPKIDKSGSAAAQNIGAKIKQRLELFQVILLMQK